MNTYVLGTLGDRILTVKKCGAEYIVTISVKDKETEKYIELPPKRWASFCQVIHDVNSSVKAVENGRGNVKFQHHIGGAYYVSVTSGIRCVDLRKFYESKEGEIKPGKTGVALRLEEWAHFCELIDIINHTYPSLASTLPCFYRKDHRSQIGMLQCSECHPFKSADKTA